MTDEYQYAKAAHIKRLRNEIQSVPSFIPTVLEGICSSYYGPTRLFFAGTLADYEEAVLNDIMDRHEPVIMFNVVSNAALDYDGVPYVDADGVSVHTLTIRKATLNSRIIQIGDEQIEVNVDGMASVDDDTPTMVDGSVSVEVGPCDKSCTCTIEVLDPNLMIESGKLKIRFCH